MIKYCKNVELNDIKSEKDDIVELVNFNNELCNVSKTCFDSSYSKVIVFNADAIVEKLITLQDTFVMSLSEDYKTRFIGEYYQVLIRYFKIKQFIKAQEKGMLECKPVSNLESLKTQKRIMGKYLFIMETRAKQEGIELNYKAIIE